MERQYHAIEEIDSTNNAMKLALYASETPRFDVLSAERQTGGRGRQGRRFYSPAGGIYFSAAYPLPAGARSPAYLTLLAGLAIRDTLQKYAEKPLLIKWPNDIRAGEKKLCGVLTELIRAPFGLAAVVGVGVNVRLDEASLPEELKTTVTDLYSVGAKTVERPVLIREIVEALDRYVYAERALERDLFLYRDAYNAVLCQRRQRVRRVSGGEILTGVAKGIDERGRLVIETENGAVPVGDGIVE